MEKLIKTSYAKKGVQMVHNEHIPEQSNLNTNEVQCLSILLKHHTPKMSSTPRPGTR